MTLRPWPKRRAPGEVGLWTGFARRYRLHVGLAAFAILASLLVAASTHKRTKSLGLGEMYWLMDRACVYGDEISVAMLLEAGADPTGPKGYEAFQKEYQFGFEPMWHLIQATRAGHPEIVKLLLRAGANPDLPYGEGVTALTEAAYRNQPEIVRLLLSAGADKKYESFEGTALEIARRKGYAEIVTLLDKH